MRAITSQEKEDYLLVMYQVKQEEDERYRITKADLCRHLGLSLYKVNIIAESLIEEGYLMKGENKELLLTSFGLNKSSEYMERRHCLTELIQMISGVDYEQAERNAHAMEHVIDMEVYLGIRTFMGKRHLYTYTVQENDLNFLFPYGEREMPVAFYRKGSSYPRTLSKEYYIFQKKAKVVISAESYIYLRPEKGMQNELEGKILMYKCNGGWRQAKNKNNEGYAISTDALECEIREPNYSSQATVQICLVREPEEQKKEENISILTVSLI